MIKKEEIVNIKTLKAEHTLHSPVFVIGHGRSGTSVTIKLLRKYIGINFGTESQFIIRCFRKIKQYGDLAEERNIKLLIDDLCKERCFYRWNKRFGFVLDREKVFTELPERSYKGVLISIFSQFAKYHQMERWGDKTPKYTVSLPILYQLFPDAQFVHIVRDGRDVFLSMVQASLTGENPYRN